MICCTAIESCAHGLANSVGTDQGDEHGRREIRYLLFQVETKLPSVFRLPPRVQVDYTRQHARTVGSICVVKVLHVPESQNRYTWQSLPGQPLA